MPFQTLWQLWEWHYSTKPSFSISKTTVQSSFTLGNSATLKEEKLTSIFIVDWLQLLFRSTTVCLNSEFTYQISCPSSWKPLFVLRPAKQTLVVSFQETGVVHEEQTPTSNCYIWHKMGYRYQKLEAITLELIEAIASTKRIKSIHILPIIVENKMRTYLYWLITHMTNNWFIMQIMNGWGLELGQSWVAHHACNIPLSYIVPTLMPIKLVKKFVMMSKNNRPILRLRLLYAVLCLFLQTIMLRKSVFIYNLFRQMVIKRGTDATFRSILSHRSKLRNHMCWLDV